MKALLVLCVACCATAVRAYGLEQKKSLTIAGKAMKLLVRGSAEDSKVSLDEVAIKGDVYECEDYDVKVNVQASYDFGAKAALAKVLTTIKGNSMTVAKTASGVDLELESQSVAGQTLSAEYKGGKWDYKLGLGVPSSALDKVKDVLGGRAVSVSPEVSVAGKSGSVAIAVDAVKADLSYGIGGSFAYEATYSTSTPLGALKATLLPKGKVVAVELVDDAIEDGASWKANFDVPIDANPAGLTLDDLNLKVKRTIKW